MCALPASFASPITSKKKSSNDQQFDKALFCGRLYSLWNTSSVLWKGILPFFESCLKKEDGSYRDYALVEFLGYGNEGLKQKKYVLIANNQLIQKVLRPQNNKTGGPFSGGELYEKTKLIAGETLLVATAKMHDKVRNFSNQYFTSQYVKTQSETINQFAKEVVNKWIGEEKIVDASVELPQFTSRLISTILLGYKPPKELAKVVENMTHLIYKLMHGIPLYPALEKNPQYAEIQKMFHEIVDMIYEAAAQIGEPTKSHSMIIHMIKAKDKNGNPVFTKEEVTAMIKVVLIGGQETTSEALKTALAEITKNPKWQEAIYQEVHPKISSNKEEEEKSNSTSGLNQSDLLKRIFHATLFMAPPAYGVARTVSNQEYEFDKVKYPPGTVFVPIFYFSQMKKAQESEKEFAFDPDLFLNPEFKDLLAKGGMMPFSRGKSECLGKNYAEEFFTAFLTQLYGRATTQFAEANNGELEAGFMLGLKYPLKLNITKRN